MNPSSSDALSRENDSAAPDPVLVDASAGAIMTTNKPVTRLRRQIVAAIWISMAWITGTVVFELTANGGETDIVRFQSSQDSFLGLFHDERPQPIPDRPTLASEASDRRSH